MGIGIFCGIMILKEGGIGNAPKSGRIAMAFYGWLEGLMAQGGTTAMLVPIGFASVFFIIAAIGLFNLVRGSRLMASKNTAFGKSILHLAKDGESFASLVDSINEDMEREPYRFGDVYIGRTWIVEAEAMRLADIRGVFCMDEGMEDYVLCCVDEAENIWASGMRYSDQRDKAAEQLQKMLPSIATGDKNDYIVFLGGEPENAPEPPKNLPVTMPPDAAFSFADADGIPTSNFTYEDVLAALRALEDARSISLKVLTPADSKVSEVLFTRAEGLFSVSVLYTYRHEDCRAVKTFGADEAESILETVISQKLLPVICV